MLHATERMLDKRMKHLLAHKKLVMQTLMLLHHVQHSMKRMALKIQMHFLVQLLHKMRWQTQILQMVICETIPLLDAPGSPVKQRMRQRLRASTAGEAVTQAMKVMLRAVDPFLLPMRQ